MLFSAHLVRCVRDTKCCFYWADCVVFVQLHRIKSNASHLATSYRGRRIHPEEPSVLSGWKPAISMPRFASGFFMNVSHTNPVRTFSAINIVIPVSMPRTSVSYQFVNGLKASMNP